MFVFYLRLLSYQVFLPDSTLNIEVAELTALETWKMYDPAMVEEDTVTSLMYVASS